MKGFLVFLLGLTVGGLGVRFYLDRPAPPAASPSHSPAPSALPEPEAAAPAAPAAGTAEPTPLKDKVVRVAQDVEERTREFARDTSAVLGEKLRAWKLTPEDLREDLKRGGAVVRTKAREAGAGLGDARLLAMVKAKYVLDRELSARKIDVDVKAGEVTLRGEVPSAALIGHAIALALDTDGVVAVVSRLTVAPAPL